MSRQKKKQLYTYLLFLYIANLSAISANYAIFMLPEGLSIMGATGTVIGFIIGAPRLVLLVLSFILKEHAPNVNEQKMSFFAACVGAFVFLIISFSLSLHVILIVAFIYGFTFTVGMTYITSVAIRYIPQKSRLPIMGLFTTSASLGVSVGPLAVALFANLGKNSGFPNFSMLGGVVLCIIWATSSVLAARYGKTLVRFDRPNPNVDKAPKGFKAYAAFMPIAIIFGILFASLMTFVPAYAHVYHIPHAQLFFIGFGTIALLERLFLFKKMSIWKKRSIIYGGFVAYFIGFGLIIFLYLFQNVPLLGSLCMLLAGMLVGGGHGLLYPTLSVLFTDLTPKYIANATFTFVMCFMFSAVLSYPLGYLADQIGYPYMLALVHIVCALWMLYALFRKATRTAFDKIETIS